MSFTLTYDYDPADQPSLSWESMRSFMKIGWGSTGQKAYDDYCSFNRKFFSDQLPPAHISFSYTSQFGGWLGQCAYGKERSSGKHTMARITLCRPLGHELPASFRNRQYSLCADSAVLLHEMLHLKLFLSGMDTDHASAGWIDGVLRMSEQLGVNVDFQPQIRRRIPVVDKNGDCETTANKRIKRSQQRFTPAGSLSYEELMRWPHTVPETLLNLPISFAGGDWPESELELRTEPAYRLEIQQLREKAKSLIRDSAERQQDFCDQLKSRYRHHYNLARYDLAGLIDTMERPNNLTYERPTNPDVKWSKELGEWVLLNCESKSDESERVEDDIFD